MMNVSKEEEEKKEDISVCDITVTKAKEPESDKFVTASVDQTKIERPYPDTRSNNPEGFTSHTLEGVTLTEKGEQTMDPPGLVPENNNKPIMSSSDFMSGDQAFREVTNPSRPCGRDNTSSLAASHESICSRQIFSPPLSSVQEEQDQVKIEVAKEREGKVAVHYEQEDDEEDEELKNVYNWTNSYTAGEDRDINEAYISSPSITDVSSISSREGKRSGIGASSKSFDEVIDPVSTVQSSEAIEDESKTRYQHQEDEENEIEFEYPRSDSREGTDVGIDDENIENRKKRAAIRNIMRSQSPPIEKSLLNALCHNLNGPCAESEEDEKLLQYAIDSIYGNLLLCKSSNDDGKASKSMAPLPTRVDTDILTRVDLDDVSVDEAHSPSADDEKPSTMANDAELKRDSAASLVPDDALGVDSFALQHHEPQDPPEVKDLTELADENKDTRVDMIISRIFEQLATCGTSYAVAPSELTCPSFDHDVINDVEQPYVPPIANESVLTPTISSRPSSTDSRQSKGLDKMRVLKMVILFALILLIGSIVLVTVSFFLRQTASATPQATGSTDQRTDAIITNKEDSIFSDGQDLGQTQGKLSATTGNSRSAPIRKQTRHSVGAAVSKVQSTSSDPRKNIFPDNNEKHTYPKTSTAANAASIVVLCQDNKDELFEVNGQFHDCSWLASSPAWKLILCDDMFIASKLCPETCERCAD